jgi:hypothetical protein
VQVAAVVAREAQVAPPPLLLSDAEEMRRQLLLQAAVPPLPLVPQTSLHIVHTSADCRRRLHCLH